MARIIHSVKCIRRLRKEYPNAHRYVLKALASESYAYWLAKKPDKAAASIQQISDYELPEDAEPELIEFAEDLKKELELQLTSHEAEAAGLETDNGQLIIDGEPLDPLLEEL